MDAENVLAEITADLLALRPSQAATKALKAGSVEDLVKAACSASQTLTPQWCSQAWARLICEAEKRAGLFPRDGKLLKPVSGSARLLPKQLAAHLLTSHKQEDCLIESRQLFFCAWSQGRLPGKHAIALARCWAYLHAGQPVVAQKDAHTAMAYGPQKAGSSTWAPAWAALGRCHELQSDLVQAALACQVAVELSPHTPSFQTALDPLLDRIPAAEAQILQAEGSKGLRAHLAQLAEEALPEFKRRRPKYFYYFQWMRERVEGSCGQLPGPVMDKLLTHDATELDMLCTFPDGIRRQAEKLQKILEDRGPAFLETFKLPLLTWEEAEELKRSAAPALESAKNGSVMLEQGLAGHGQRLTPIVEEAVSMNMQRPPHDSDDEDWDDIEH